jgi:hypothetical protein
MQLCGVYCSPNAIRVIKSGDETQIQQNFGQKTWRKDLGTGIYGRIILK